MHYFQSWQDPTLIDLDIFLKDALIYLHQIHILHTELCCWQYQSLIKILVIDDIKYIFNSEQYHLTKSLTFDHYF